MEGVSADGRELELDNISSSLQLKPVCDSELPKSDVQQPSTTPKEGQIFHTSTWASPLGVNSCLKQTQK